MGFGRVPAHKGLKGAGCLETHHVGATEILGFVPQYLQDGAAVRTLRTCVLACTTFCCLFYVCCYNYLT